MSREKEVTIYDIADKLNISIATVSRALKDDPVVNKKTKKTTFCYDTFSQLFLMICLY